ncbi:MAG: D-alanyl-D-alanine carboxypeptidase family protein [Oscillospiraceae bacterium]|nr:D-alanyl-D-alanine carboxypeptidase family protein [Oscillospiraceae bacterium]
MHKKILALLLALSIFLPLLGCNKAPGTGANQSGQSGTTQAPPETPTTPSGEDLQMVLATAHIPELFLELKYSGTDNLAGKAVYNFQELYLRQGTVKKLQGVVDALKEENLTLKIWDGFRPTSAQQALWDACPDAALVQNPATGSSPYNRGSCVSVTLADAQGNELTMPSGFDDLSSKADRDYSDCTAEAAENAKLLQSLMEQNGFTGNADKWWQFTDTMEYPEETCFDPAVISLWYVDGQEEIPLLTEANADAAYLETIAARDHVTVLGYADTFALVSYESQTGYIEKKYLQSIQELASTTAWTPDCNEHIKLYKTASTETILKKIPKGAEVVLNKWSGKYAKVTYKGTTGYVLSYFIMPAQKDYFTVCLQVVKPTDTYTYEQMLSDIATLKALYPDQITVSSIGKSELGKDLPVILLGNTSAKQHVFIQAAIHGREHMTAWLAMTMADYALSQNQLAAGDVCYHIVPMSNPDGVEISQTGKLLTAEQKAIYKKDLAAGYTNSGTAYYAKNWKANALGVDLNRNFPSGWENSRDRLNPSYQAHCGSAPFIAAETKALRDYTLSNSFSATISLHSQGSVLYYNYGKKQPVNDLSRSLALAVQKEIGYTMVKDDGTTGAGYKDWVMDELGIPSLTIETGSIGCPLPKRENANLFARFHNVIPAITAWLQEQAA